MNEMRKLMNLMEDINLHEGTMNTSIFSNDPIEAAQAMSQLKKLLSKPLPVSQIKRLESLVYDDGLYDILDYIRSKKPSTYILQNSEEFNMYIEDLIIDAENAQGIEKDDEDDAGDFYTNEFGDDDSDEERSF
jgi:hypothetical protein